MGWNELDAKDKKGSRGRCLALTDPARGRTNVAGDLTRLLEERGVVAPDATWAPAGPDDHAEVQLGRHPRFLDADQRRQLNRWWLAVKPDSTTQPVWDLVSAASFEGRDGLLLVEAKAHATELDEAPKRTGNLDNEEQIRGALGQAASGLAALHAGAWRLAVDSHYQLANRFAWGWKVASMGVPVVLVYLGFLDAEEMAPCPVLRQHDDWERAVHAYADPFVPADVWGQRLLVPGGAPFIPLIRTATIALPHPAP